MVAVIGFWLLPNWPDNTGTYYFSAEESEMAQYRAEVSTGGRSEDDEGGYLEGLTMACKDPFTWMFAGQHFALILMQSYKDFLPSVCILFYLSNSIHANSRGRSWILLASRRSRRILSKPLRGSSHTS